MTRAGGCSARSSEGTVAVTRCIPRGSAGENNIEFGRRSTMPFVVPLYDAPTPRKAKS